MQTPCSELFFLKLLSQAIKIPYYYLKNRKHTRFPPYITQITQEMIYNRSNQYFLATHSPFILNDLLENAIDDLSVYMVDYKNHETIVKHLDDKTLHEIYQSGVDLFTNSETFI